MSNLENATIAIQKSGRLTEGSLEWLNNNAGTDFPVAKEPFDERRQMSDIATGITVLGYSNGDILKSLACGQVDYGISGQDKLLELVWPQSSGFGSLSGFNRFANLTELGVVQPAVCRMVVARRVERGQLEPVRRIATSYPNLASKWLGNLLVWEREPDVPAIKVDYFSGGIEMIGRMNGYDTVVDVVHRGESLRKNGFEETDEIGTYSSVLLERRREAISPELFDVLKNPSILGVMSRVLKDRKINPTGSETSKLVRSKKDSIEKIGEETTELIVELATGGDIELEAADLLYSICAALVRAGKDIRVVEVELAGRYQGQALQSDLRKPSAAYK